MYLIGSFFFHIAAVPSSNFMLLRAQEQSKQKESEEQETILFRPAPRLSLGKPQNTPHREMICSFFYLAGLQRIATISRDGMLCYWSDQLKLQRCFPSVVYVSFYSFPYIYRSNLRNLHNIIKERGKQVPNTKWRSVYLILSSISTTGFVERVLEPDAAMLGYQLSVPSRC